MAFSIAPVYAQESHTVTITLDNVNDVSPAHLEGWIITGEQKTSFGKFSADDMMMGMMGSSTMSFTVDMDISMADSIAITIEPEGDIDDDPSGIILLSGQLTDQSAKLSFPVDFDMISGTYILATPSNGAMTDENSGIWFLELPEPPSQGLFLPELPSGWVYEGWVVHEGTPISSGRFSDVADFDLFNGYSASMNYPPFPGEDFLLDPPMGVSFPLDLGDGMSKAVISVEPDLMGVDPTGDGPFSVKPLIGDIPEDALDHTNYDLVAVDAALPSGLALVSRDTMSFMSRIEELEVQVSGLESEVTSLENEVVTLEAQLREQDDMDMPMVPLGSWRAVALVAFILGLALGVAIIYLRK
ncbi:hypothetical protein GF319_08545 [Candidatus Bathyarchaeota archaeon]|nr:hypothetical protein [Candidatus Bathyarchaeota archaeon]